MMSGHRSDGLTIADPKLLQRRVGTLYRCDNRGRLLTTNEWDSRPAPRFFLMRTATGVIPRFHADAPDGLVEKLQRACRDEPFGKIFARSPVGRDGYIGLLAAQAPVKSVWSGPCYRLPVDLSPSLPTVAVDVERAHLLVGGFEDWIADVVYRQPFIAFVEDGHAVAICASVRISDAVHCAGVETLPAYRRRGFASTVVSGWAQKVRELGATPFYSTSWENVASQGVAKRLGGTVVGFDFHVT